MKEIKRVFSTILFGALVGNFLMMLAMLVEPNAPSWLVAVYSGMASAFWFLATESKE